MHIVIHKEKTFSSQYLKNDHCLIHHSFRKQTIDRSSTLTAVTFTRNVYTVPNDFIVITQFVLKTIL